VRESTARSPATSGTADATNHRMKTPANPRSDWATWILMIAAGILILAWVLGYVNL
jgi:hypothetical protein